MGRKGPLAFITGVFKGDFMSDLYVKEEGAVTLDKVVPPAIALLLHGLFFLWIGPVLLKNNAPPRIQPIQFEIVPPKIQLTQTASGPPQGDKEEAPKAGGIKETPGVVSTLPKGKPKAAPAEKQKSAPPPAPTPVSAEEIKPAVPEEAPIVLAETAQEVLSTPAIEEVQEASAGGNTGGEGTNEAISEGPGVSNGSDQPGIVGGTGGLGFPGGTGTADIGSSLQPLVLGPISPGMPDYDGLGRFRNAAFKQIQRHQHYPKRARDRGIEGVVNVQFTIDQNGKVHEVTVLPSEEAHPLLAQAAMETIRKASPLPAVPDLLRGHDRIVLTLGMRFELK